MKWLTSILPLLFLVVATGVLGVLATGDDGTRDVFGDMTAATAVDVRRRPPDKPGLWIPQHSVYPGLVVVVVVDVVDGEKWTIGVEK